MHIIAVIKNKDCENYLIKCGSINVQSSIFVLFNIEDRITTNDPDFHIERYVDKMRWNDGDEKRACIIRRELNH